MWLPRVVGTRVLKHLSVETKLLYLKAAMSWFDQLKTLSLHERRIVVAIDFGTTFSGVAWAKVLDGHTNLVDQWPAAGSHLTSKSSEKAPTEILYDEDEPGGFKWGFQIPGDVDRHQWFKLNLDSKYNLATELSKRYPLPSSLPLGDQHMAQKLTADYLGALKKHLIDILQIQLGEHHAKETPLQFILTVPAVWSDAAKEATLQAAETAGLGQNAPILMISEPEAAATYALHRKKLGDLSIGDTFVICDAGGGTVDLISYTIEQLEPALQVKEAAPGSGALCGSTYLNRRFQEYLKSKLGGELGYDQETLDDAMKKFDEEIKREFSTDTKDAHYWVPVPGLSNNQKLGIQRNKLTLPPDDLREILKPVIDEVVKLVRDQIRSTNKDVKAILLVGGFGGSQYLFQRLRESIPKNTAVLQPGYGWSAVVQGALLRGLADCSPQNSNVRLTSRVARKHIGKICIVDFDEAKHLMSRRFFHAFSGQWRTKAMSWIITKGDAIKEDTPFTFSHAKRRLVSMGKPEEYNVIIYHDCTDRPPVVYRDQEVLKLVRLHVKVSDLPPDALELEMGKDDDLYYNFKFTIEVTYQSGSTKYGLLHKGEQQFPSRTESWKPWFNDYAVREGVWTNLKVEALDRTEVDLGSRSPQIPRYFELQSAPERNDETHD
ncbi:hypothetical protein V500_07322 [Pseudogymnoascus sp. VKM F-4518 (FW-2643)]|nr:hypothetical protein V500_07322 [Pseudogymnoascus sp. VKM F-4518 (FW-2643)]